ncbi:MAG TPA: tetratricopeptide repeat protein, partial [Candidatus Saccharimonadia bacterium]|nr:tetratricopeptide repeat protein [Candidatus Saccharimonadia bacterium]
MLEEILELHKQGKLDEAESRYRELLTFNPDDPETLHLLAMLRRQRGDVGEAVRLVHRAIELSPERAPYYATLAGMELHARRFDLAKEHFEKAIELNPNFTGAYAGLGQIAMMNAEPERAEGFFKLALQANPDQPQVLSSYGNLHLARGDAASALKFLTRASELASNDATVLGSLGRAHLRNNHAAFAEEALKRALALNVDFHPARLLLAEAQMKQQRYREARETLVPLLRIQAQLAGATAALGDIARAEGNLQVAVNYYREALTLDRKQPAVLEALAWSLMQRGMRREAIAAYREHLAHAPQDRAARRALVNLSS